MLINRNGNRFVASFDAADMLRKVIDNTENAVLVFECSEDRTTNSAMLIDGDCDAVARSIASMGIPCIGK